MAKQSDALGRMTMSPATYRLTEDTEGVSLKNQAVDRKDRTIMMKDTLSMQQLKILKLQKEYEQQYQTKTVEIDLKKVIKPNRRSFAHAKSKSRKESQNNSREQSRERKSLIGPSYVTRRDTYEDSVTSFMDENIEQIARLSALKQKIQADIFDQSKTY